MFVDINRGGEQIRVNMDIAFPNFPCDILSLDAQDIMGTHTVNVGGQLYKKRTRDGVVIGESVIGEGVGCYWKIHQAEDHHEDHSHPHVDLNRIQQAFKDKEGCELVGHIIVNKVPGKLKLLYSFRQFPHLLACFRTHTQLGV
jgi:hypothetical protein